MTDTALCAICQRPADASASSVPGFVGQRFSCKVCGTYDITHFAQRAGPCDVARDYLYVLSGLIRHNQATDLKPFIIDRNTWEDERTFRERVLSQGPTTVQDKLNAVLTYLANVSRFPGDRVRLDAATDYSLGYCRGPEEFVYYVKHLVHAGLIVGAKEAGTWPRSGGQPFSLTVAAWDYLRGLQAMNTKSGQGFVAMWFSDKMTTAWSDGIRPLEADTGFKMIRVDNLQFNEDICDKIVSEIRRSRFVVAEVTGQRPGVYFEAGFAMGLGLPVIWVCREDDFDSVHFDARQYNHIVWSEVGQLREKLRDRILATVGVGPMFRGPDITRP